MIHKQLQSQKSKEILSKVREIANGFPETVEQIDKFGHTSFRVKDKPFVILGENEEGILSIAMKTSKETQNFYCRKAALFQDTLYRATWLDFHFWGS
jgi:hypothetical protein